MQKRKYWSGAHTRHKLMYHIVWIPKFRKRILEGKVKATVERLIKQSVEMNLWSIHEMNVQSDHIHILIQFAPSMSVSEVVKRLKGATSRIIRKEHPELEEFFWGPNFWGEGYFAETVGNLNENAIRQYINNQ